MCEIAKIIKTNSTPTIIPNAEKKVSTVTPIKARANIVFIPHPIAKTPKGKKQKGINEKTAISKNFSSLVVFISI
ncbi:MAG: hypothetical protein WCI93_03755 [bacterium]